MSIRREREIGRYPLMISASIGRNSKSFKRGHWCKWDKAYNFLGCACGNPNVPHEGIYEDYFYACANVDAYFSRLFQFHSYVNNRKSFGSYYAFNHRAIRAYWSKRHRSHRYGITLSLLSRNDGKFYGPIIQWSEDP